MALNWKASTNNDAGKTLNILFSIFNICLSLLFGKGFIRIYDWVSLFSVDVFELFVSRDCIRFESSFLIVLSNIL